MLAGRDLKTQQSCGYKNGYSRYLCHEVGKLRDGMDSAGKATALILPILLGKLKTHMVRKREIYFKERFNDKENL